MCCADAGAFAKLKSDVLGWLPCIRKERESESRLDEYNDAFRGFAASHPSTDSFRPRDTEWSFRESGLSEADLVAANAVENSMHKDSNVSGLPEDFKGSTRLSMMTSEHSSRLRRVSFGHNNYEDWGEDELTQEISRLHSVDRHDQSREL
jgi:hypothetical protein